jgi:carbamoyltransferase
MQGSFLGPAFEQAECERCLGAMGAQFDVLSETELVERCAALLDDGRALGWFQGRMEFGPRALGARSILADPRPATMQRTLNLKVKFRESFRPFAPAVLREHSSEWFDLEGESPYMQLVANVQPGKRTIPAVTHVDGSARLQTVDPRDNPRFHSLLSAFHARTGCPVLVNTSFNVRGEPIVCTPEDAFRCFMASEIDALALENCLLIKERQPPELKRGERRFDPD